VAAIDEIHGAAGKFRRRDGSRFDTRVADRTGSGDRSASFGPSQASRRYPSRPAPTTVSSA